MPKYSYLGQLYLLLPQLKMVPGMITMIAVLFIQILSVSSLEKPVLITLFYVPPPSLSPLPRFTYTTPEEFGQSRGYTEKIGDESLGD